MHKLHDGLATALPYQINGARFGIGDFPALDQNAGHKACERVGALTFNKLQKIENKTHRARAVLKEPSKMTVSGV
jgi:hypothetical protein